MSSMPRALNTALLCLTLTTTAHGQGGLAPVQEKLAQLYPQVMEDILPEVALGQARMLAASGLKDEAAKLSATAERARQGASQKPDKALFTSISSAVEQFSTEHLAQSGELSDSAKKEFLDGLVQYVNGVSQLKGLSGDLSQLGGLVPSATQGLSMVDAARAKPTVELAKALTSSLTAVTTKSVSGMGALKAFTASRNIPVPADLFDRVN